MSILAGLLCSPREGVVAVRAKIDSIQGLRGLAALAVVVSHSLGELIEHAHIPLSAQPIAAAFGDIGVRVFFVISGFIMTVTTAHSFGAAGASLDFIAKRLIRIAPLYWLVTMAYIAVVMWPRGATPDATKILLSLAFIPYLNDSGQYWPVYVPGWTLNYEMLFYALFAIALIFRRGLGFVLAALILLVVAGMAGLDGFYTKPVLLYFAAGIALALIRERAKLPPLRPHAADRAILAVGDASYSIYLTHSFLLGVSAPILARFSGIHVAALWMAAMLVGSILIGLLSYRILESPMTRWLRSQVPLRNPRPGRTGNRAYP
jgi:exopolysaccharide production protein ExoZ